jgi:hypothetical protein
MMNAYSQILPISACGPVPVRRRLPLPPRMQVRMLSLPLLDGYPVPFFAAVVDGEQTLLVRDQAKHQACIEQDLCWICGQRLGVFKTFAIPPVLALHRISFEPPSHIECAEYAIQAFPFILLPTSQRGDGGCEEGISGRIMTLMLNAGVGVLWTTKTWTEGRTTREAMMVLGEPTTVRWFVQGRPASRAEAQAGMDAAFPRLQAMCRSEIGRASLANDYAQLVKLLPRAD